MKTSLRRVRAEIDLDAIRYNFDVLTRERKNCRGIAVIKADAYGHGAVSVARALKDMAYGFAVATAEEAVELRDAGIMNPILILGPVPEECFDDLVRREIRLAVFDRDTAASLSESARRIGKNAFIHVKVDTGMSRIGLRPDESGLRTLQEILSLPGIVSEGIFTHFATMDMPDESHALGQAVRFSGFLNLAAKAGISFSVVHLSNSAALLRKKLFPAENAARLGISLYGVYPSEEVEYPITLRPAMQLKSSVTYVKEVPAGTPIGYGETFVTRRPMRIATVSAGYADGIPRSLSNKGEVLIRGRRARILGRICMDQFMVDVTGIPEASAGDEAVILGRQDSEEITIYELSRISGRFPYEFLTCVSKRVPRVYLQKGKSTYGNGSK